MRNLNHPQHFTFSTQAFLLLICSKKLETSAHSEAFGSSFILYHIDAFDTLQRESCVMWGWLCVGCFYMFLSKGQIWESAPVADIGVACTDWLCCVVFQGSMHVVRYFLCPCIQSNLIFQTCSNSLLLNLSELGVSIKALCLFQILHETLELLV